jgi:uncharacterized protein YqeY
MIPLNHPKNMNVGLPIIGHDVDIYELITVTARLKELLSRETEHLKRMEVGELAKLADEKQKLTKIMESYQRLIAQRPELVRALDADSREELALLMEDFTRVVSENMQRTAVARAVNQRVVQAIMEVVTENQHAGTYNRSGYSGVPTNMSVSFNLNQKA